MKVFDYLCITIWILFVLSTWASYTSVPKNLRHMVSIELTPVGVAVILGIPLLLAYRLWG
jgi:hypothetical protein